VTPRRAEKAVQPTYLVIDTSGSTALNGWIGRVNALLPTFVEKLERVEKQSSLEVRISMIHFGTTASVFLPLTAATSIELIPTLRAEGFTTLSSAIRILATTISEDSASLHEDGYTVVKPVSWFFLHDLPTDRPDDVLTALDALFRDVNFSEVHLVCSEGIDPISLRGLGFGSPTYVNESDDVEMVGNLIAMMLAPAS
jgi:uncharacterized protein YegL